MIRKIIKISLCIGLLLGVYWIDKDIESYKNNSIQALREKELYEEALITYINDVLTVMEADGTSDVNYQRAINSKDFQFYLILNTTEEPMLGYATISRYTGKLLMEPEVDKTSMKLVLSNKIRKVRNTVGFDQYSITMETESDRVYTALESIRQQYPAIQSFYVGTRRDFWDIPENMDYGKAISIAIEQQLYGKEMIKYFFIMIVIIVGVREQIQQFFKKSRYKQRFLIKRLHDYLQRTHRYQVIFIGGFLIYLIGNSVFIMLLEHAKNALQRGGIGELGWLFIMGIVLWNLMFLWIVQRCFAEVHRIRGAIRRLASGQIGRIDDEKEKTFLLDASMEKVRALENKMVSTMQTIEKSERLKTELLSRISKDLQQPLEDIVQDIYDLKKQTGGSDVEGRYIHILEERAARLNSLIQELAELEENDAYGTQVALQPIHLNEVVQGSLTQLMEKFQEKGIEVYTCLNEQSTVKGDEKYMWRILENLLSNMLKYAKENSKAYIKIKKEERYCVLTVENQTQDNVHMKAEALTERFVRGDKARTTEGFGLGLAIAKRFVELQGGELIITTDDRTFRVQIKMQLIKGV
ncbi:MAG: sensor histidine kinase [Cellulosilyticaceae bacterium]